MRRNPRDFLPLSGPALHILLALGGRALHGYAMMDAVESRVGPESPLLPGTLYSALARMEKQGLVKDADPENYEKRGGARRYYRATSLGRAVARAEMERLDALVEWARSDGLLPAGTGNVG